MRRHIFNFVFTLTALVSLLLVVSIWALWVRGVWWTGDLIYWDLGEESEQVFVRSANGRLSLEVEGLGFGPSIKILAVTPNPIGRTFWWPAGEVLTSKFAQGGNASRDVVIGVADWCLILLFSVLPFSWVLHSLRCRRDQGARCLKCGYDLRVSKDACPECGEPIPVAPASLEVKV